MIGILRTRLTNVITVFFAVPFCIGRRHRAMAMPALYQPRERLSGASAARSRAAVPPHNGLGFRPGFSRNNRFVFAFVTFFIMANVPGIDRIGANPVKCSGIPGFADMFPPL